jgi:hypothetical protein
MKLLLLIVMAGSALAADWNAVRGIPAAQKIEVTTKDGKRTQSEFVAAAAETLSMRVKSGEQTLARTDVRQIRVYDPSRRLHKGILWTLIGAGAGLGVGVAACPSCANEGAGYKYAGPGTAIGAGVGALGFFSSPYRTVYKVK